MAQHDYIIANQSGASFRADLNNGLAAAVSQNSGAAEPSTTYAYMPWADTTTGLYKIRNGANSAWIPLYKLDGTGFSAANGNVVFTLPSADGTARQALVTNGAAALSFANRSELVLATSLVATGSNSVFDFTSIPSWVKRITLMCYQVSTTISGNLYVQIGSGSFQATGYSSTYWYASTGSGVSSDAFVLSATGSAYLHDLTCTLTLVGSNKWMLSGISNLVLATNVGAQAIGSVELSGTLDRLRFATGAGVFDAGTINILYEG